MDANFLLSIFGVSKEDVLDFSGREDWARVLGVGRKTIYNWEREIIDSSPMALVKTLYWSQRRDRKKLDFYQKFLLMLIAWQQQRGAAAYADLKEWFAGVDPNTMKPRILRVNRMEVERFLCS